MQLRPYQSEALAAIHNAMLNGPNKALVCIPTGGGKTPLINTLAWELYRENKDGHIIICTHTQELIDQSSKDFEAMVGGRPGVYANSLKRKDIGHVTFAQIQSIYKKHLLFQNYGPPLALLIDECDRIPVDGNGQYRTFIKGLQSLNPNIFICGFTATPYRMSTGMVYGEGQPFDDIIYDARVSDLIRDGYLSNLVGKRSGTPDLSKIHVRHGDYIESELETEMTKDGVVDATCDEIVYQGLTRIAWLVFTSGAKHAKLMHDALTSRGIACATILGTTDDAERKRNVELFRRGELRCLISVNVLSVGFNVPHVDLIALTRPTKSPGMYYQQVGRGLRVAECKSDCLILDFANNISTHGSIDTLNDRITAKKKSDEPGEAPVKECVKCHAYCHAAKRECPYCGHVFPPIEIVKHNSSADINSPLASEIVISVSHMTMMSWPSKFKDKPDTLLIKYFCQSKQVACEWLPIHYSAYWFYRSKGYDILTSMLGGGYSHELSQANILVIKNSTGRSVQIDTPLAVLQIKHCFRAPSGIVVNPPPKGSRYPTIVRRVYAT